VENVYWALRGYIQPRDLGRAVTNDSGVKTERGPDTVRGPDVAFYSYNKVPKGPLPDGYWPTPELVVGVRSPSDRWADIGAKTMEYLKAGVLAVCVLDPETESVGVYTQNEFPRRLTADEELTLTEVFPDFRVTVRQLFE
jgi:Uma2 family endonuclease